MFSDPEEKLQNAAILTRGVERILRKLIRFLVGKISLVKLQQMIRYIYVEESERSLRLEKPGRDVSLTRLALLTGLDTRTLAKTRNDERYRKPLYQMERFVKTMTPESCVLDLWISKSEYLDPISNEPRKLSVSGDGPTFERLVRESVASRGITVQSILTSLVNNKAVKYDEGNQTIELLERILAPFKAGNHWGAIDAGLVHVCCLLETVFHNFGAVRDGNRTYYQRGCWTHRLSIDERLGFEQTVRSFLKKTHEKAVDLMEPLEAEKPASNQTTAGISLFYFEESIGE